MLRSVLHIVPIRWPQDFPKAEADIEWLLGRADSLEDQRNYIVHAPLYLMPATQLAQYHGLKSEIFPNHLRGHRRAIKPAGRKSLLTEIRWVRDNALCLRDYAADILAALDEQILTWPDRPQLSNREEKSGRSL